MAKESKNLTLFDNLESNEKPSRAFLPSPFISASLPLRDIKGSLFTRKYNGIEMILTGAPKVPYGVYGRLVLSLLTTHAVLDEKDENGNVVINYSKEKEFLDELQAPKSRGKNFREQLEYFSNSTFVYKVKVQKKVQRSLFEDLNNIKDSVEVSYESTGNIAFIKKYERLTLLDGDIEADKKNRNMSVVLNADFVKLCVEHAVPINYTTYSKLSATGKDLYAWFVYRNNSLNHGDVIKIPKEKFVEQFMPVKDAENNKTQVNSNYQYLREQIEEIKKYYKDLDVYVLKDGGGIVLRASPPEIFANDKRYVLITAND